jgi:hypothetical protein
MYPKTLELLRVYEVSRRERALNDPDEQLREWAQNQLENFT